MDFEGVMDQQYELAETIKQSCKQVQAHTCGLDYRCGELYIGEDFVATINRRSLDYYGGFEYVDPEYVTQIGDLTIYSCADERVNKAHPHD